MLANHLLDRIAFKENMICKMNVSFYFISLIFVCSVSMISSQNETQMADSTKNVGPISCYYFGTLDTSCGQEVIPISKLPKECNAYFHDGLKVDMTLDVAEIFSNHEQEMLDNLITSGKPVYVRYGHDNIAEWTQLFGCDVCAETNAIDEMKGVKAYLDKHKGISGIVLTGLIQNVVVGQAMDTTIFPNLSESLKTYISVMKKTFTELKVGIAFPAWFFVYYYEDPIMQQVPWFDFTVLNEVVDFYEISSNCLNSECTPELKNTGITPMNGNADYTLEKVQRYLDQVKIPKEKIHYRFQLAAASPDFSVDGCSLSFQEMCLDPKLTKDWCSDTLATMYEKGVFAKQKGNGVIVSFIDFDDPNGCCCKKPFPGFHAIVDGFNCAEPPKPCPLFDRS